MEIFYGCKIISPEIGLNQTFSSKFFGWKFSWMQNNFLGNSFEPKIFIKNVLLLQNHFLGNRFERKFFIENFWSKLFYGCKIISSGICLNQNFSSRIFWSKIFYRCKIISSEIGLNLKWSSKNFLVENFLWLQNHFLENRFAPKFLIKIFFMVAKSFSRK